MKLKNFIIALALIFSGECVFILPFLVSRIFRPTFLRVFEINNLQLGTAFSIYGIIAMLSYFIGGPIADRFSPKKLMAISLIVTAAGGLLMATIPSFGVLTLLYGFWGITTILLFWAAFIKATRVFGGLSAQGRSFGLVDAGRGLIAAILASVSVALFNSFLPELVETASIEESSAALGKIILIFSSITVFSALLVWMAISDQSDTESRNEELSIDGILSVIKNPTVWWQTIIVLCSYVGYKCTDDFSLYASEVLGYNDVEAANVATISFWVRPFAAIAAGFLGDKLIHSKIIGFCFLILIVGSLFLGSGIFEGIHAIAILNIAIVSIGIYGLRGLYFALMQESKVPLLYTGSAVGFISLVGYTPDVFMGPLMGYILDQSPRPAGHHHLFYLLAAFGILGLFSSFKLRSSIPQLSN